MTDSPHEPFLPRLTDAQIEAITAGAERDAGAPREMLGTYVEDSFDSATSGRRLSARVVDRSRRLGLIAAERGVDLPKLLDLYLSATWRLAEIVTSAPHPPRELGAWATALFRASDDAAAALGAGYQAAQRRAIRREESIRREFVDDLLRGRSDAQGLRELARQIGFNLASTHRCVVATTDRPLRDGGPVQAHVEQALLEPAALASIVATKDGAIVCVLPPGVNDPGPLVLRCLQDAEPGPWELGVGGLHSGTSGAARSYREAIEALGIARRLELSETIGDFVELAPFRLLTQDMTLLGETVEAVLGPLAAARGGAEPLIATLEAFFDESLSTTGAARRLHLSVRAVTYRLERIDALTGRSLRNPHDRYILETAVRGRRLLSGSDGSATP